MSAGTTNLGDLELARAGIQARREDGQRGRGGWRGADGGRRRGRGVAGGCGRRRQESTWRCWRRATKIRRSRRCWKTRWAVTIVWTRQGYACYRATLTGAFPAGKTLIKTSLGRKSSDCWWAAAQRLSEDAFLVYTTDNSGSLLEGFQELQVEIYVYP